MSTKSSAACFHAIARTIRMKAEAAPAMTVASLPAAGTSLPSKGSPLFSVELELGQAELVGGEVKHGHEVRGGTVAARFAFGRTEDAVPAFHERIGHAPLPVRHHACQMVLDQCPQRHQTWKRRRARVAVGLRWMSWSTSRI